MQSTYFRVMFHAGITNPIDFWLMLPIEILGIILLIVILVCLHVYHLNIRRKTDRVKDQLTTVEQNETYETLGTRPRSLSQTSVVYETVQGQLTDDTHTITIEPEYDYIDLPQASAANRDFSIERNESYAIVTVHQTAGTNMMPYN